MSSEVTVENGQIKVKKLVTSHSETVQVRQYEPNQYFTSLELDLGDGVGLMDVKSLQAIMKAIELANTLCANNNRKSQWRDGCAPRIGASAEQFATQVPNSSMFDPANIVKPEDLNKHINKTIGEFKKILGIEGVKAKMTTDTTKESEENPAPEKAPIKKKRSNPARKAQATTPAEPDSNSEPQEAVE